MKKKFDWERFKTEKIAVHCKTEEEAKDFCRKMYERDMMWDEETYYDMHGENTCYTSYGTYCSCSFYEKKNYTILEWSDYMQKEFTKADLKDGMILYFDDGVKAILVNDCYITRHDIEYVNGRLMRKRSGRKIIKIEYGEKIVYESETTLMTVEEMRQKLEELTGEKIEVIEEANRETMLRAIRIYCREQNDCYFCRFDNCCPLNEGRSEEYIKQCYEKVIADGKE